MQEAARELVEKGESKKNRLIFVKIRVFDLSSISLERVNDYTIVCISSSSVKLDQFIEIF